MSNIKRILVKDVDENTRDYHVSVKLTHKGDQGNIWYEKLWERDEAMKNSDDWFFPHTFDAIDALIVIQGVARECIFHYKIRVFKSAAVNWDEIDPAAIDSLKRALWPGHEHEVEVRYRTPLSSKKPIHRIRVKIIDENTCELGVSVKLTRGANSRIHCYETYDLTAEERENHKFFTAETCDATNRLIQVVGMTHVLTNKYEFVLDKADIVDWVEIQDELVDIVREIYFPGVEDLVIEFIKVTTAAKED